MEKKTTFLIVILILVFVIIGLMGASYYSYLLGQKQAKIGGGIAGALYSLAISNMIDSANLYTFGKILEVSETVLTVEKEGNKIAVPISKDTIFNRIVLAEIKEGEQPPLPEAIEAKDLKVGEDVSLTVLVTPEGEVKTISVLVMPLPILLSPEKSPLPAEK